jgi:hypothetical protein
LTIGAGGCTGLFGGGGPDAIPAEKQRQTAKFTEPPTCEDLKDENASLSARLDVLSELPEPLRGKRLHLLESVRLGKYTGLYDQDDDGTAEKLIVYIRPRDRQGDIVKALGTVLIELWLLDGKADEARVGQWEVGPAELAEQWFATLVTINYRLRFDLPDVVRGKPHPLTVKMTFTDHLSGQTFTQQMPVESRR